MAAEAAGQAKRLWKLGCDNAQGYFYAKPMAGLQMPGHFLAWNDKGMKTWGLQGQTHMAADHNPFLQDTFLDHLRKNDIQVMMFLVNGIRLQGYVKSFDKFSVQLARGDSSQMVFKHAISAINPDGPIQLIDAAGSSD
jgi:host factor-I protein